MVIALQTSAYRVRVTGACGATILSAEWCKPDGTWISILAPLDEPEKGLSAGCFVMAPFANRIVAGRFQFDNREIAFPMNRPGSNMACHGIARDQAWTTLEATENHAVLECSQHREDYPWRFRLRLSLRLQDDGIVIGLSLQNGGAGAFPFGFGLHPYFPKRPGTRIAFSSAEPHRRDALGLPLPELDRQVGIRSGVPVALAECPGIDMCFPNWHPSVAFIDWPSEKARLRLESEGALQHLHLFVPEAREVFCLEPVSHLPDAINRPWLGASAGMHILAPGEELSGTFALAMSEDARVAFP